MCRRFTRARPWALLLVLCAALWPAGAHAQIASMASVTDGDTIKIHGERIRLHGIDAPESRQICKVVGEPWMCGKHAAPLSGTDPG